LAPLAHGLKRGPLDILRRELSVMKYNVDLRGNKVRVSPTWDNRGSCINVRLDDQDLLVQNDKILAQLHSEGFSSN
jgi:hypothetical protein